MKTLVSFCCLITTTLFSQGVYQNSGVQVNLKTIAIVSDQIIYVGGAQGVHLKTTNGGDTWTELPTFSTSNSKALSFVSSNIGYACVSYNISGQTPHAAIYKTTNGGATFDSLTLAGNHLPFYTHFINELIGFYTCLDGTFKTIDGGQNWLIVDQTPIDLIYFPTDLIGYGVTLSHQLIKSVDGGENWIIMGDLSNGEFYTDLTFPSTEIGYTCSSYYGAYGSTLDGGQTISIGSFGAHSIHFPSTTTGYYLRYDQFSDSTLLIYTHNTGQNWDTLFSSSSKLNRIRFATSSTGWAVGDNGTILKISNSTAELSVIDEHDKIVIYPNPTSEYIFIEIENDIQLEEVTLFNLNDKFIKKSEINNMTISDLDSGIYSLKIKTSKGVITRKIVITHTK